ncbi:MAG: HAMP domain-containing histidine kinase [Anaerolineae bacterium]|nr:HAMP domain-containing histidine kinase [Anaerolineae bacterium]
MTRRWLWALVPLLAGMLLALLFDIGWLPNPTLYLRADLAALVQICGLTMALALWGGIVLQNWSQNLRHDTRLEVETRSAEDRRRFLQRLDHELKNPLTAIQAGLANLGDKPNPGALSSVKTQTTRVSRLVADLRKLADLETRPLERAPVNLGEILQTLTELGSEGEYSNRKISLTIPQAPWPLPEVSGDYDLLLLAIHNLLNNALKFTKPGDRVEVRALEDGQTVVIEVADTGPGIPAEELPHVWEELYRGKGARGVPGSGLGLALVRAIMDRHGGQVSVRSRAGQGTVVGLRIPV